MLSGAARLVASMFDMVRWHGGLRLSFHEGARSFGIGGYSQWQADVNNEFSRLAQPFFVGERLGSGANVGRSD